MCQPVHTSEDILPDEMDGSFENVDITCCIESVIKTAYNDNMYVVFEVMNDDCDSVDTGS